MIKLRTFPPSPIDGQPFYDTYGIAWVYSSMEKGWVRIGPPLGIPLAKAGKICKE